MSHMFLSATVDLIFHPQQRRVVLKEGLRHINICVYIYRCNTKIFAYVHNLHPHTYTYMHAYIHTYMYVYIHIYIYIYL